MLRGMGVLAALLATAPSMAAAQPAGADRQLLSLADGEACTIGGISYTAHGDALAILVPSPELVSIAVLDGRLAAGGSTASPGEVLVTTADGRTRRFGFDAARLAATLRPDWAARVRPPLDRIASVQRRQHFWGRIEPVGVNAAAPRGPRVEAARAMAAQAGAPGEVSQQRALANETERLRLAIAYDPAAGIALRAPAEQDVLIGALATGEGGADLRVKWFMAGAIQQPASGATTRLYNPLARGWLSLDWTQAADGAWRIRSARIDSSGPVVWVGAADRPYLAGLVADYVSAHARPGAAPGDLAGMEADRWITGLAEFMHDPARADAAGRARGLIAAGHTARLGGGAIDMMPERARATYAPIAGFERAEGGRSLLFGSPLYPHILIAADFDGGERPALSRITLVNLDNAGRGQ